MWVAKQYKYENGLYLYNRIPRKVSDKENEIWHSRKSLYREFDSLHGQIRLNEKFNSIFDGLEQPVKVNLVKCEQSEAMFYIQKHKDKIGFEHLYINNHLTVFLLHKENKVKYCVDTYPGYRLPSDMFPELKEEDGYMPIKLEVCG